MFFPGTMVQVVASSIKKGVGPRVGSIGFISSNYTSIFTDETVQGYRDHLTVSSVYFSRFGNDAVLRNEHKKVVCFSSIRQKIPPTEHLYPYFQILGVSKKCPVVMVKPLVGNAEEEKYLETKLTSIICSNEIKVYVNRLLMSNSMTKTVKLLSGKFISYMYSAVSDPDDTIKDFISKIRNPECSVNNKLELLMLLYKKSVVRSLCRCLESITGHGPQILEILKLLPSLCVTKDISSRLAKDLRDKKKSQAFPRYAGRHLGNVADLLDSLGGSLYSGL